MNAALTTSASGQPHPTGDSYEAVLVFRGAAKSYLTLPVPLLLVFGL